MLTCDHKSAGFASAGAYEPIGELIERARRHLGISQYAFAEMLVRISGNEGLSRAEVARWERGKRVPGPYWRNWLSAALDLPPEQLEGAARSARQRRRSTAVQAPGARSRSRPKTRRVSVDA